MATTPTPEPAATTDAVSKAQAQAEIKEQIAKLERLEETTGRSGAVPRGPKNRLLAVSEATKAKHKDYRLRWISVNSPEKAAGRVADGYEIIPDGEGGRRVGGLALARLGKEEYERRVKDIDRQTQERLNSHNREMEGMAEQVAKMLRDNHGLDVKSERLLVKE